MHQHLGIKSSCSPKAEMLAMEPHLIITTSTVSFAARTSQRARYARSGACWANSFAEAAKSAGRAEILHNTEAYRDYDAQRPRFGRLDALRRDYDGKGW